MSEREWYFYLDGMIVFAEKVLRYTESLDQAPSLPTNWCSTRRCATWN
ncbi:MAG: hypothetical protein RBT86_03890 [Azospira sp.]|nr:hypothetical protein [Azospira sp.]